MKPQKVILHCTASKNGLDYPIELIRKEHLARGFLDVGYHVVIQPSGEIEHGRGLTSVGAHCEGENQDSIGIALVGLDRFTKAQFVSLRGVLDGITMIYDIEPWNLRCHYEFDSAKKQGKTCPNIMVGNLITWYYLQIDKAIESVILSEGIIK